MRGIFFCTVDAVKVRRFNPAYAGNIPCRIEYLDAIWVQPRVCGEYSDVKRQSFSNAGSTPRMRGILYHFNIIDGSCRFNPAYAGNMFVLPFFNRVYKVQPRVCGEYKQRHMINYVYIGSTPRMRGIFTQENTPYPTVRFNPAYAGNIWKRLLTTLQKQVQPRVCGEYRVIFSHNLFVIGSTPRMRGIF